MAKNTTAPAFDPNGPAGSGTTIFGLPYDENSARMVLLPVPWDVTVSYAAGSSKGPDAILEASKQVDLFLHDVENAWQNPIWMEPVSRELKKRSKKLRKLAVEYLDQFVADPAFVKTVEGKSLLRVLNAECKLMNEWVQKKSQDHIKAGKMVGLIGGDHSTPLGLITALAETHEFSILHIDAHFDLRNSYEGFTWSHASVMYNALKLKNVKKLVSVGIRDWCEEEEEVVRKSKGRVVAYYDEQLKRAQYEGKSWNETTDAIIANLGDKVYVSFDIDGLDPKLCPNTGTPVPGGLEYYQALSLIKKIAATGRTIIGFDVVEVVPGSDEWDANVGARLIYQLASQCFVSQTKKAVTKKKK
jgi:agmatinase